MSSETQNERSIETIDAEISAAEARLLDLKRERTGARLPDNWQPQLAGLFVRAFHDADLAGHANKADYIADGVHVRVAVSVTEDSSDEEVPE